MQVEIDEKLYKDLSEIAKIKKTKTVLETIRALVEEKQMALF